MVYVVDRQYLKWIVLSGIKRVVANKDFGICVAFGNKERFMFMFIHKLCFIELY